MRKATVFRGGANKTAPPCEAGTANRHLVTVPVEQLQRESLTEKPCSYSNSTIDKKREIMYNNSQKELKNMIPVEIRKLIIKNREEGVKVSEI
ncbi:MAG: hypothetical protein PUB72_04230, partial [Ruminococcus sp.]|nr:hypothetical protein [Ruminococcus sp.]